MGYRKSIPSVMLRLTLRKRHTFKLEAKHSTLAHAANTSKHMACRRIPGLNKHIRTGIYIRISKY